MKLDEFIQMLMKYGETDVDLYEKDILIVSGETSTGADGNEYTLSTLFKISIQKLTSLEGLDIDGNIVRAVSEHLCIHPISVSNPHIVVEKDDDDDFEIDEDWEEI